MRPHADWLSSLCSTPSLPSRRPRRLARALRARRPPAVRRLSARGGARLACRPPCLRRPARAGRRRGLGVPQRRSVLLGGGARSRSGGACGGACSWRGRRLCRPHPRVACPVGRWGGRRGRPLRAALWKRRHRCAPGCHAARLAGPRSRTGLPRRDRCFPPRPLPEARLPPRAPAVRRDARRARAPPPCARPSLCGPRQRSARPPRGSERAVCGPLRCLRCWRRTQGLRLHRPQGCAAAATAAPSDTSGGCSERGQWQPAWLRALRGCCSAPCSQQPPPPLVLPVGAPQARRSALRLTRPARRCVLVSPGPAPPSLTALPTLPHHTTTLAGCAAEGALSAPLFSWTFSVPREALQEAPLLALLRSWRASELPGPALSESLHLLLAEARRAAADRDSAADATAAAATAAAATSAKSAKKEKGAGGKKAAKAAAAAAEEVEEETLATLDSDPHGVAAALKPQTDLAPSAAHEASAAAARSQIRRYSTAVQVRAGVGGEVEWLACEASDGSMHLLSSRRRSPWPRTPPDTPPPPQSPAAIALALPGRR